MHQSPPPVVTGCSASRNVHVFWRDRRGNLHLAPGRFGLNAALICLALLPVSLLLCHFFEAGRDLWATAALVPIAASLGFLVGHLGYTFWGTRVVLDHWRQQIRISGVRHRKNLSFHFSDVCAVQRICGERPVGERNAGDERDWESYQINLVFRDRSRYNLLDSAGVKQLDRIGEALSDYLKVPFERCGQDLP